MNCDGVHFELLGFMSRETGSLILNPSNNSFNSKRILKTLVDFLKSIILKKDGVKNRTISNDYKLKNGDILIAIGNNYNVF